MLLDTVRKTISEYKMLDKGDKVLCAVSGGADSMCLLNTILSIKDEYSLSVYVANVNHLIRGEEADRDSDFVKDFCEKNHIVCFYREYDVPAISKERKMGEEECGRALRYEFFSETAEYLGGAKIATAHNLNDNAETILFRLVRGSSAQGLAGIKYKRDNIIRPLLDVPREEIERYLSENNLQWCEDSTNKISLYSRNKIRNEIVPLLERVSQNAQGKIVSAAKMLNEDNAFISDFVIKTFKECFYDGYILIEPLEKAHTSIKRRVISKVLEFWGAKEITADKIESFTRFLSKDNGKTFDITAEYFAEKSYNKIRLCKRGEPKIPTQLVNEDCVCSGEDWSVRIRTAKEKTKKKSNNIAVFDADKLSFPLVVRNRQEGDKISQNGMSGKKKLSDIFTDEKIERNMRDMIPVVEKDGEILFVCGLRKSSLYAADDNTKNFLFIEYEKLTERENTKDDKH